MEAKMLYDLEEITPDAHQQHRFIQWKKKLIVSPLLVLTKAGFQMVKWLCSSPPRIITSIYPFSFVIRIPCFDFEKRVHQNKTSCSHSDHFSCPHWFRNLSKNFSDMVFRLDQDEGAGGLSTHLGNISMLMENSPNRSA